MPPPPGATCLLADLSTRNGTLLRGQRLEPGEERVLAYGDSFSVGPVALLFVPTAAEVPTSAGAASLLRVDDPGGEAPSPLLTAVAQARLNVSAASQDLVDDRLWDAKLGAAYIREASRSNVLR